MEKLEIEKCIYKSFLRKKTPALSFLELKAYFQIVSGESMDNYSVAVEKVIKEIVDNKFLKYEEWPNRMSYFTEGLNFDQWEAKMNPQTINGGFSIGTLNASNVQVGNQNTMKNGVSADQFVKALEAFNGKPEAEKKSIMDKVLAVVSAGADVAAAVAAFVALV